MHSLQVVAHSSSTITVFAAIAGNCALAVTKFVVAAVSGSSAMLAEAIHSVLDTLNELLLLYGLRRSRRRPDELFPFGYGREVYFWSLIVAVLLFGAGGTNTPAEEHMQAVMRIEDAIRSAHPAVKRIFIEARPRNEQSTVCENK